MTHPQKTDGFNRVGAQTDEGGRFVKRNEVEWKGLQFAYCGQDKEVMEKSTPPEKYDERYFETFAPSVGIHPSYYKAFGLIDERKKGNILDIGCGRGEIVYLAALNRHKSFGIDFSDSAIGVSKSLVESLPEKYKKNVDVQKMNAKNLSFKDNTFDVVFMLDIVEHLYAWELNAVLAEGCRVLKPGGELIVHTAPNKFLMQPVRFLASLVRITLKSDEFHVNEQSLFSLKDYLADEFVARELWIEKARNYWSDGVPERGSGVKFIARLVDLLVDNPLSEFLISKTFLKFYLGTDIWAIACPHKDDGN